MPACMGVEEEDDDVMDDAMDDEGVGSIDASDGWQRSARDKRELLILPPPSQDHWPCDCQRTIVTHERLQGTTM